MNKIYKLLIAAGLALCMNTVAQADEMYLHIQTADGNWTVLDLSQVNRLTFSGGQMTATDAQGTQVAQYLAANLDVMTVNDNNTPSGINKVAAEAKTASFALSNGGRLLTANTDGTLRVFASTGALVVEIPAVTAGQTVNLHALPAGAYVINFANVSRKALLK